MSFILRKSYIQPTPDMVEQVITTAVTAGTMAAWGSGGVIPAVNGATSDRIALVGIVQAGGLAGANALITPILPGMILETNFQTGTPAIGNLVEIFDANQVNLKASGATIGRVVEVVDATAKTVKVLIV